MIVRVYTAWIGVEKSSIPSRKNGRFSGKKRAKRSFAPICATSDSICEKSGFSVASIAVFTPGVHFRSSPPSASTDSVSSGEPSPFFGKASWLAVAYGAITRCPPEGRPVRPSRGLDRQMKQLPPRGSFVEKYWYRKSRGRFRYSMMFHFCGSFFSYRSDEKGTRISSTHPSGVIREAESQ